MCFGTIMQSARQQRKADAVRANPGPVSSRCTPHSSGRPATALGTWSSRGVNERAGVTAATTSTTPSSHAATRHPITPRQQQRGAEVAAGGLLRSVQVEEISSAMGEALAQVGVLSCCPLCAAAAAASILHVPVMPVCIKTETVAVCLCARAKHDGGTHR